MEKKQNSKKAKVKRPEISLYIPPAFRSKSDKMKYAKYKYAKETANTQTYSLERRNSPERYSEMASGRVRFDSSGSSSEPKHTANESYKNDDDSSDFEDYCDFVSTEDLNISKKTNESNSDDHWETGGQRSVRNHGVETENDQILDKVSNKILIQHEGSSDVNQQLYSESNERKLDGGLFDNYEDNISDIEAIIDRSTKKRSILTSTPNSDITEQKVLNAANYVAEEDSELESTLFGQTDIYESTNGTNRNECVNNFDIYHDPPSIENQPIDYTEIFGNNYIPPPIPPPASTFRLPSIQHLPSPTSQPHEFFAPRHAPLQNMPPFPIQLRRPRQIFVPSAPQCPNIPRLSPAYSSYFPPTRRHILSPCLRPATIPPANATRVFSTPPTVSSQERIYSPRFLENVFFPPYLRQQNENLQRLEMYKQGGPLYIPPSISHPQMMKGSQQISNLNLRQNVQSCPPSPYLLINRMVFDAKFGHRI